MINNRRSFITGIKSTKLTNNEKKFLRKYNPWGIILFARNIKTIKQTKNLTTSIRILFKDKNYPILIDQEGGRINRLKNIIDMSIFTSEFFSKLYINDKIKFDIIHKIFIKETSKLLKEIGINLNTVPVLDVRRKNASKIIGDRSFGYDKNDVSTLGNLWIGEFHKNNIGTVIKHIPGHGLAKVDSHKFTPTVNNNIKRLNKIDFFPFKNKKSLFAMTAHVIYRKIDDKLTATHSKKVINIIRKNIKFKNLLISDDISMKSLKFNIINNTKMAFEAGCNLVLHCNANYKEMLLVARNSPKINKFIYKKTSQFYKILR